jgi:hypothetical protein
LTAGKDGQLLNLKKIKNMESIKIEIEAATIKTALEKQFESVLSSSYSNPVRTCIESALKEKDGEIKKIVDEIISQTLNNPEFKTKLSDIVLQRMVDAALKK